MKLALIGLVIGSLAFAIGITALTLGIAAHLGPTIFMGALCIFLGCMNFALAYINWSMRTQ